jgi:urease accessory protein
MEDELYQIPSAFLAYENEKTALRPGSVGKNAIVRLNFEEYNGKTHLVSSHYRMPARVSRPLYYDPEQPGVPIVQFINPSGGTLQGDRYYYTIKVGEDASALLVDAEATKLYKMEMNYASRHIDIYLSKKSILEFLSKETIAYARSRWYQRTTFHVEKDDSRFLYSEIFCPGRIARNEYWEFDIFASKFLIKEQNNHDEPLLIDNVTFKKEDKDVRTVLFGENKFLLSTYWYSKNAISSRDLIKFPSSAYVGVTEMPFKQGTVVKALSNDLDDLRQLQLDIWHHFRQVEYGTKAPDLRMY